MIFMQILPANKYRITWILIAWLSYKAELSKLQQFENDAVLQFRTDKVVYDIIQHRQLGWYPFTCQLAI